MGLLSCFLIFTQEFISGFLVLTALLPQTEVQDPTKRIQCCFPKVVLKEEGTNSYFLRALYVLVLTFSPLGYRDHGERFGAWRGGPAHRWLMQSRWWVQGSVSGPEISKTHAFFPPLPPLLPSCSPFIHNTSVLINRFGFLDGFTCVAET